MLVSDPVVFEEVLSHLQEADILTCDFETNYCKHQEDRYILGLAVHYDGKGYYFPFGHKHEMRTGPEDVNLPEECLAPLLQLLLVKKTIWHNAKFDLQQIEDAGFDTKDMMFYDTLVLSLLENENKYSHRLHDLGRLVGEKKLGSEIDAIAINLGGGGKNKVEKEIAKTKGWHLIPPSVMGKYAEEDVLITWKLFKLFFPRIQEQELEQLIPEENELVQATRKLIARGIGVSVQRTDEIILRTQQQLEQLESQLGIEPGKPSQLARKLYLTPEFGGVGLQPLGYSSRRSKDFAKGIPIMDEDTLAMHTLQAGEEIPVIEQVMEWRKASKALSTYYRPFRNRLDSQNRLHPDFRPHSAVTTRWTCGEPNLQQLPRDQKVQPVKKLFEARPGHEIWEFDYSQQEFRLAVVYVNSKYYSEALRSGADIHSMTAQNIGAYDKFPNDPEKARYAGKQLNFLVVNGGGPGILQKQVFHNARIWIEMSDCKKFHRAWHDTTPEFEKTAKQVEIKAKQFGYIKLWNGRKRHFEHEYDCRAAFNSLVQGGAAQITNESVRRLDREGHELLAQVHDAIWVEIPTEEVEETVPKIKSVMEWPSEKQWFSFPFPVDAKKLAG